MAIARELLLLDPGDNMRVKLFLLDLTFESACYR
jgi:hypothetical protein